MRLLEIITQAFIDFFGITQPDDKTRRRATFFICGLLGLLILIPALVFALIYRR